MENADDDISILNSDTIDGSPVEASPHLAEEFVITRSSSLGTKIEREPAVHALQSAYSDLKNRYNEVVLKNRQMSRALRDVGKVRGTDAEMSMYNGDAFSINAQGAAAMVEQPLPAEENRAQMGYVKYLEREKMNNEVRLQQLASMKQSYEEACKSMEKKLKDTVTEVDRKDQDLKALTERCENLRDENFQLREERDLFRKQMIDYQERLHSAMIQSSLEKENRQIVELREQYTALETKCAALEKECDRLRVSEGIAQTDLQTSSKKLSELEQKCMSLDSKNQTLETELQRLREYELPPESSMPTAEELVHLKKVIADLRGTVLQQRNFLSKLGKTSGMGSARSEPNIGMRVDLREVTASSPRSKSDVVDQGQRLMFGSTPEENSIGRSWERVPDKPLQDRFVKDGPELSPRRSQTVPQPSRDRNNLQNPGMTFPNANPSAHLRTNLANESGTGQTSAGEQTTSRSEVIRRRPAEDVGSRSKSDVVMRRNGSGINDRENVRDMSPRTESPWQQQTVSNISHMNGGTAQYQSTYENANTDLNFNPTRQRQQVVSDFGLLGQDRTPAFPVPPELQQETNNSRSAGQGSRSDQSSDKMCPVCLRDFSAMNMEDFQTHVFECFDDSNAPETLQAVGSTERICPMCNALYPEAVSQEEFEKHVQTHFEQDIVDRFEILNP